MSTRAPIGNFLTLLATAALTICGLPGLARAHDEGPPGFDCENGPFGVPGLSDPPAQIGQWGPVMTWPTKAVHGTVLGTGKVLFHKGAEAYLWDIATVSAGALFGRSRTAFTLFRTGPPVRR